MLIVIGSGGFAREVLWLLRECAAAGQSQDMLGIISEEMPAGTALHGVPVLGNDAFALQSLSPADTRFVVAVGDAGLRRKIAQRYEAAGFRAAAAVIHPQTRHSAYVKIGDGTIICAGCTLTTDIEIGKHCALNLHCTVGHDVRMGDYSVLAPSVNLSGGVQVGEAVQVGTGAILLPNVSVNADIVIGAGAVVVKTLREAGTYIGIPAQKRQK